MAVPINRVARLLEGGGNRRERASRRVMTGAVVISLLIHVLAVWRIPSLRMPSVEFAEKRTGPLSVQIVPPPPGAPARARPPAVPAQKPSPPPAQRRAERPRLKPAPERRAETRAPKPAPQRRAEPPPPPRPPVIARAEPGRAPAPPSPKPPPTVSAPPVPQASAPGDLASFVEARRRARGESAPAAPAAEARPSPPPEDPNARANRIAAANLGLTRPPTFGPDPRKTGGIFNVTHMASDYAEFLFYGWNRDIKRNTVQTIEVRRGTHPNIQIAVVRRMIAIIREYEQGDFTWESTRLGRNVTLSARPRDNSGLEDFLMREFFEPPAAARR